MTTTEPDLTIAVYSQDGACTEFYQNQEMSIKVILDQTLTPRLFAQPLLKFSSERGVSWYASRIVDMIKLKTTAIAPLVMPPGLEDIAEVNRERFAAEETPGDQRHPAGPDGSPPPAVIRAHVEIHTAGAWVIY